MPNEYKKLIKALMKEDRNEAVTNKYLMRLRAIQERDEKLKEKQLERVLGTAIRILDEIIVKWFIQNNIPFSLI
ncbi:hypothetical protein DWB88_13855 (plasmid) [Staphylococcus warneri]|nr:hypothetical protein DWB88_13855 [Staphylococcus warneri]